MSAETQRVPSKREGASPKIALMECVRERNGGESGGERESERERDVRRKMKRERQRDGMGERDGPGRASERKEREGDAE